MTITVQDLRKIIAAFPIYGHPASLENCAAFDALAARTDALEAENAAILNDYDAYKSGIESLSARITELLAENAALAKERDEARLHAFDVALDALHAYQQNWDTGSPAEYASHERVMMECACEQVREALEEAKAEIPQAHDKAAIPDECAASGEACSYAPQGRNGEMQCRYSGKPQAHDKAAQEPIENVNHVRVPRDIVLAACYAISNGAPAPVTLEALRAAVMSPAYAAPQQASEQRAAVIPDDCDVRKILLRVVPGDGNGLEVYAKNVGEVEALLSELGERLEDFESASQSAPVGLTLLDAIIRDMRAGFVKCETCGDQQDTKDLDFMSQLLELRDALASRPATSGVTEEMKFCEILNGWYEAQARGTVKVEDVAYRLVTETAAILAAHPVTKAASDGVEE